jgi:IclR family transcriptional regulator, acetate operon repressor
MESEVTERIAGSIQSVMNALAILEAVGEAKPVGVSQLARQVNLPKSSVQRALKTLEQAEWIRHVDGDQTRWELSPKMLSISLKAFGEYSLRDYAIPAMDELRRRTGETIHLIALEGDSAIVIHRLDSAQAVRTFVPVGTPAPLHATASGHAILAFLPPERVKEILAGTLPRFTDASMTDAAEIEKRLVPVRERGYAVQVGEWRPEVASISSPIFSITDTPVGALTISIPASRFSEALIEQYGSWARELSSAIGPVSAAGR